MAQWEKYIEDGEQKYGWRLICDGCKQVFHARRSDAKTCSINCRKYVSRAPQRKLNAMADLQAMGRRVNEISRAYSDSQDMLDQVHLLQQALDRALANFEVEWKPQKLKL